MKKLKKKKLKTITQLKKKLDTVFSIYVRSTAADQYGHAQCYTCGVRKPWKELQCGHFIRRSRLFTRWEPKNCRVQCARCNVFMSGNYEEFADRLLNEDVENWKWLMWSKGMTWKFTREELEEMIQRFTLDKAESYEVLG